MIELVSADVEKRLAELGERGRRAAQAGAFAGMTLLLERAVPNVPKKTGRLVGSAFVTPADGAGDVEGGFADPKAAFVHEGTASHVVGTNKFLERAVNAHASEALEASARAMEAFLLTGELPAPRFPTEGGG